MENTKKLEMFFIPCPVPGHIVSTVEFANRILSHHPRLQVTILVMRSPTLSSPSSQKQEVNADDNKSSTNDSNQLIRYINLPEVVLPPKQLFLHSPEEYISTYIALHKPHVRAAIDKAKLHPTTGRLAGIVVDMLSTSMIDVANDLGIPSYLFFASSAAVLGLMLDLPTLKIQFKEDDDWFVSNESDTEFSVSTFANPVPFSVLPTVVLKKSGFKVFSIHAKRFAETKGIIVNTFSELEPFATNSHMSNTLLPHVYNVGPVLNLKGQAHEQPNNTQTEHIMTWLDHQPESSVLFLCFGSAGSFSEPQMKEIAIGLVKSRIKFIWSLRKPRRTDKVEEPGEYTENELKDILPCDFISCLEERRGLVCGWAPQVEVLAHRALGGFVSHCGWNSILESLWFGVPIVTWPLYAEQQINASQIVKELGLAMELRLDSRRDRVKGISKRDGSDFLPMVTADEIEKAIGYVMDPDDQVRKRVKEISEISKRGLMDDGGSSFEAMECLFKDIVKNLED